MSEIVKKLEKLKSDMEKGLPFVVSEDGPTLSEAIAALQPCGERHRLLTGPEGGELKGGYLSYTDACSRPIDGQNLDELRVALLRAPVAVTVDDAMVERFEKEARRYYVTAGADKFYVRTELNGPPLFEHIGAGNCQYWITKRALEAALQAGRK